MAVALDARRSLRTFTVPGSQTRPRSLRPRSTSITCSARSFSSVRRSFSSSDVLLLGGAAPPGARDRVRGGHAVEHGDQRLRAGADDVEALPLGRLQAQQVHVRARVGGAQHPVDVERRPPVHGISNRCDTTTWNASPAADLLLRRLDGGVVLGGRAAAGERGLGRAGRRRRSDGAGAASVGGHPVQPGHGVVVGLVDALVAGVPVDRVGDQRDRALVVVDGGEVGGQQHHQLGQLQVVHGELGQALQPAHRCRSRGSRPARRSAAAARAAARCAAPRSTVRSAASGSPAAGSPAGHLAGPRQRRRRPR